MRVSISVGKYAKTPYCVPGLETNVYCVEELCYCVRENACLLDLAFLDDRLLNWLGQECDLKELVKLLYPLVHKQGSLSAFAVALLQYVGLYDNRTVEEVERVLKQGAGLSAIERRKTQVDHLVRKKKYKSALKGYDALLEKWREQDTGGGVLPAASCLAAIWHNKGVAFAGMMLYEEAAECFLRAYELDGGEDSRIDYLTAMHMYLPEEEYVEFVTGHPELLGDSIEMEKRLGGAMAEWERQPDYLRLYNRSVLREDDRGKYLEESERMVRALQDHYRRTIE
jgi:tetratricopeptide (TPR) repeat protein